MKLIVIVSLCALVLGARSDDDVPLAGISDSELIFTITSYKEVAFDTILFLLIWDMMKAMAKISLGGKFLMHSSREHRRKMVPAATILRFKLHRC